MVSPLSLPPAICAPCSLTSLSAINQRLVSASKNGCKNTRLRRNYGNRVIPFQTQLSKRWCGVVSETRPLPPSRVGTYRHKHTAGCCTAGSYRHDGSREAVGWDGESIRGSKVGPEPPPPRGLSPAQSKGWAEKEKTGKCMAVGASKSLMAWVSPPRSGSPEQALLLTILPKHLCIST